MTTTGEMDPSKGDLLMCGIGQFGGRYGGGVIGGVVMCFVVMLLAKDRSSMGRVLGNDALCFHWLSKKIDREKSGGDKPLLGLFGMFRGSPGV